VTTELDRRRARARRIRAELLKTELRARHAMAPDGYLSANPTPLSPGTKTPDELANYENYIPTAVRKAALRANHKVRGFRKRKHRKTGRRRGPQIDDSELAQYCLRLMDEYRLTRIQAEREVADALAEAQSIELKSARARVRRAMRNLA
jgi:hypothetical protein